jgi:hypothetical protein
MIIELPGPSRYECSHAGDLCTSSTGKDDVDPNWSASTVRSVGNQRIKKEKRNKGRFTHFVSAFPVFVQRYALAHGGRHVVMPVAIAEIRPPRPVDAGMFAMPDPTVEIRPPRPVDAGISSCRTRSPKFARHGTPMPACRYA